MRITHFHSLLRSGLTACLLGMLPLAGLAQSSDETDNYSRLDLSLVSQQPVYASDGVTAWSTHNLQGVGVGYLFGINVTGHHLPLFLEVGPECSFTRRSEEIDYWDIQLNKTSDEVNTQLLSLSTPLDLSYHCRLNDDVVLAPAVGLQAKVNLLAKVSSEGETTNLLDGEARRFQLGWNLGCGLYYNRLYLGLRFTSDVTPFLPEKHDKLRYQCYVLTLGVRL